jgi:hypothetical protein
MLSIIVGKLVKFMFMQEIQFNSLFSCAATTAKTSVTDTAQTNIFNIL